MKTFGTGIHSLLLLLLSASLTLTSQAHGIVRFVNGHWLNGASFEPRTMFSVEGILRERTDAEPTSTVDLGGAWIIPPLADAHHHDFGSSHDLDALIGRYIAQGIFYVKNPNAIRSLVDDARPRLNTAESVDVAWSLGGLTSSGGHPVQIYDQIATQIPGWTRERMENEAYTIIDGEDDLDAKWSMILEGHPDFIKVYLEHAEEHENWRDDPSYYGKRGLDPKLLPLIVKRAHGAALRVTAHVSTAYDFRTAVLAGVDEIAHLPLEKLSSEDAKLAARQGTVVVTTTISHRPAPGVDLDDVNRHNLGILRESGVRLAFGTDNSPSVVTEVENIQRLGIFSPVEILRIWTTDTPQTIFPGRKIGLLADGYEASFIALSKNPLEDLGAIRDVRLRVKKGHILQASESAAASTRPSIANALGHVLMSQGVEHAIAEYRRMRSERPDDYDYSEPQLNALGYALLGHRRVDDAIAILHLNAEIFPRSANVWDSLGEAYMTKGDRKAAIENYRKSLALNPGNDNATEMIRKLEAGPEERPPE